VALAVNLGLVRGLGLSLRLKDRVDLASGNAPNLEITANVNKLFARSKGQEHYGE
jgi:hypothetical protein